MSQTTHDRESPRRRAASLAAVSAYENPRVIRAFARDYDLEPAEARLLFREMLKLVWLTDRRGITIWGPWVPLDDMWHAFVLHTKDYADFCHRYFGRIVHHDPETRGRVLNRPGAFASSRNRLAYERKVHDAIDIVWKELGPRTANLWFHELWGRYTPEFLVKHRRAPSASAPERTAALLAVHGLPRRKSAPRRVMRPTVEPRSGRPKPLADVLRYRNPRVINGFCRDYNLEPKEARLLFREMLKLLWLTDQNEGSFPLWPAWKPLDDMWHWFVLHTKDYAAFCHRHFGRMLHHDPETHRSPAERRRATALLESDDHACLKLDCQSAVRETVEVVWKGLGARTANRWFKDFWTRYTPAFLDRHWRAERGSA